MRPTEYMKKVMADRKAAEGKAIIYDKKAGVDTGKKAKNFFQNEFADEKPDTSGSSAVIAGRNPVVPPPTSPLSKMKLFDYRLKFSSDYVLAGVTNNILVNRYQPYAGGQGPIQLNNGTDLNFSFKVGRE